MASLDIQIACQNLSVPAKEELLTWIEAALQHKNKNKNVSLRIVDRKEMQQLNAQYRNKDKPTNVLSFSCDLPDDVDDPLLGDIVICGPVIEQEAKEQKKQVKAHWAHLLVHGTLHLQGYDHVNASEASLMEGLETDILVNLGFPEPYEYAKKII